MINPIARSSGALPIARYRFTARAQQPFSLPDYAGSLLRGQFGAALRNVACMTRQPTCPGCPLLQTCPYTRIFEAPPPPKGSHALQDFSQIPNPYVIEPPTPGARVLGAGDDFSFNLVLVGHARDQLALVVFALQRALQQGLTRQRVPVDLLQVDWVDAQGQAHPIWNMARPVLSEHPDKLASKYPGIAAPAPTGATATDGTQAQQAITLQFHTPLRLQHQGKPLGVGQLTPRALVAAVARRTALLMEFHAGQSGWGDAAKHITHLSENLTDTRKLQWFDWTRYSSRQQQEMTLGGVLGSWTLQGDAATIDHIRPWLWLGQWLHVGKNATMGLGGYTLEAV
ncbi:MAG: CRISPR system precrRNA processing endoribonuclease RAMP protein Cas6 [Rhodoferax sp.]|nr:CRISPR system precrRNA processing endoribonuclease RAMP protein Cas6 [Rhodoferax sp.]